MKREKLSDFEFSTGDFYCKGRDIVRIGLTYPATTLEKPNIVGFHEVDNGTYYFEDKSGNQYEVHKDIAERIYFAKDAKWNLPVICTEPSFGCVQNTIVYDRKSKLF